MKDLNRIELELKYLKEDFDIQIKRADKCIQLKDTLGGDRWITQSKLTYYKIKTLNS